MNKISIRDFANVQKKFLTLAAKHSEAVLKCLPQLLTGIFQDSFDC